MKVTKSMKEYTMRTLLLATLCITSVSMFATSDIAPADVTAENVQTCIEQRLENEDRETVLVSMRQKLDALFENGDISEEAYEATLDVVNTYAV